MKNVYTKLINQTTICDSSEAAIEAIQTALSTRSLNICFVNAHAYNLACRNPEFVDAIQASDFVFRDGIGVKLLYQLLKLNPGANLNGTDLIPELLSACFKNKKIAIFGSTNQELMVAERKLSHDGYDICVTHHGFDSFETYLSLVDDYEPDLVLLAMGMPKQEKLAKLIAQHHKNTSIISGGAIVDFMAGKVTRAPEILRKLGLEWLYRLFKEPRRLFTRYVLGNGLFLVRALRVR